MTDYREKQDQFDVLKWYDSIREGEDKCGSYEFCESCRKEEEYPCARAAERYGRKGYIRIASLRARS